MAWYKVVHNSLGQIIDDDFHIINQMLSHGQQLSISEVWYQLTIINVRANDYGTYVCEGKNKLGGSQYNITVFGMDFFNIYVCLYFKINIHYFLCNDGIYT